MKNLLQMMKQAQEMQSRLAELQAELDRREVTGEAAGGMVRIVMTAKGEARRVAIDPSLVDPAETAILEDLILTALKDARAKAERQSQEAMAELAGGLSLPPGFKLPF